MKPTEAATPFIRRGASLLLALTLVAAACSSEPERPTVLADLSTQTLIPAYESLAASSAELSAASTALCADPSPVQLADVASALDAARLSWAFTNAMWLGPVTERRSLPFVNWPSDPERVESLLANTEMVIEPDLFENRVSASQRGFGTIDHLLDDATGDVLTDERRCAYVESVAEVIAVETGLLLDDWTVSFDEGAPYAEQLADPELVMSVDEVVNSGIFMLQAIVDLELGPAIDANGGGVDLEAIAEGPAGAAAAELEQRLLGLRSTMVGPPPGVDSTIDATPIGLAPLLGDDLTARLTIEIDEAIAAARAIDGPLRAVAADEPDVVGALREEINDVRMILATEVVSLLGVTVGFSDADGDATS